MQIYTASLRAALICGVPAIFYQSKPMFDDLAAYFHENVVASFEEYRTRKGLGEIGVSRDIRTAMNAASALFHLREHLLPPNDLTRAKVESLCPDYAVLGDIVNVSKHVSISRPTPHGNPLIANAADLNELLVITEYEDEKGIYTYCEKQVVAKLADGTSRDIYGVLINVMNFWQSHLHALGIISSSRTYSIESNQHPKSRSECEATRIDLEMVRGLRFRLDMLLQKYNYQTGSVEPVDLTGANVRMKIRPPPRYDVDVILKHEATGAEYKAAITLSGDESLILEGLPTDAERTAYVSSLPKAQEVLRQLAAEAKILTTSKPELKSTWWKRVKELFQRS